MSHIIIILGSSLSISGFVAYILLSSVASTTPIVPSCVPRANASIGNSNSYIVISGVQKVSRHRAGILTFTPPAANILNTNTGIYQKLSNFTPKLLYTPSASSS